jgi:O-antigen ligase
MDAPVPQRIPPPWLHRTMLAALFVFLISCYFSIAVNSLSLGLMAICWAGMMAVVRRPLVTRTPLDMVFLAYVLAELLSSAFSLNPGQSFFFARRVLLIGIVYFLATWVSTEKLARSIVATVVGTAALVGLLGVGKLVFSAPGDVVRLGIFQFYMTTAELMMVAGLLLLPFAIHSGTPRRVRVAALVALIPILVSLYGTVTRGAYVAFAVGTLLIALVRNKKLVIPLLILVVLLIVFAPPYVKQRLESIVDLQHPENASRLLLWGLSLRIWVDHPVLGVGDIDLGDLFRAYASPGTSITWGHAHNVPLQFLVTLGALGFVIVTVMFVAIARMEWRVYRASRDDWFAGSVALGALAVFAGILVMGLVEWSFGDQEVVTMLWVTVGLTVAIGRISAQRTGSA